MEDMERMDCLDIESARAKDDEPVVFWRAKELRRAGFDAAAVLQLARRLDIDLHVAVGLLERGCPPSTALLL